MLGHHHTQVRMSIDWQSSRGQRLLLHCDTREGHCPNPNRKQYKCSLTAPGCGGEGLLYINTRDRDISESRVNATKPHLVKGGGESQETKRPKGKKGQVTKMSRLYRNPRSWGGKKPSPWLEKFRTLPARRTHYRRGWGMLGEPGVRGCFCLLIGILAVCP